LEKWKSIGCFFEREPVYIGGVNVWEYKWITTNEPSIKLAHPSYLNELHDFNIYYIEVDYVDFKAVKFRFAVTELSNGVYGFYIPD
jgi:hypothetical protein